MKKIFGILTLSSIFIISTMITPVLGYQIEEFQNDQQNIDLKLLLTIGLVTISNDEKLISGFVIIGYIGGEIITFQLINIEFEGFALPIYRSLFITVLIYNPV